MTLRRTSILGTLLIVAAVGGSLGRPMPAANPAPAGLEPGKPVAELQLTLDQPANGVLEVTFENVGKKPTVLNLGDMVGNGRELEPVQFNLIVAGPSGKSRQLNWKGLGGYAGRVDDFLVPLMPMSKYAITFSVDDLIGDGADGNWSSKVATGEKVQAVYEGAAPSNPNGAAIPALPIWIHQVESAAIRYVE
jgi:hypothetical protein